ncbi:MAG: PspC domain-containing protein [Balneolaceae bacterium]|nr:PspC domain-containing protein [Balneolaceae bacterium]
MAEKTKEHIKHSNLDSMMEFEDHELQSTMQEFLEEEKKANTNIWNFATITGIAMFFVGMLFLIQTLGLAIGPDLTDLVEALPFIGGALVTLVGFGFLVGDRKKVKKQEKAQKKKERFEFDFGDYDEDEDFSLENDLFGGSSKSKKKSGSKSINYDSFALKQSKKLYKSRTNKKWAGVCGGLGRYFGISPTVIRLLFVITTLVGWGSPILVYIALMIVLDKEPPELMDDFDF